MARSLLTLLLFAAFPAAAAAGPTQTLQLAAGVLGDFSSGSANDIPPAQLADAYAVAVFPRVVRAGLLVGGQGGRGVVLARDARGGWGEPVFARLSGASFGLQAGAEAADVVLVFPSRASLARLLTGTGHTTDGRPGAEVLTYTRGRGLFVGASLDGVRLRSDAAADAVFSRDTSAGGRELVGAVRGHLVRMSPPPAPTTLGTGPEASAGPRLTAPANGSPSPVSIDGNRWGVALSAVVAAAVGLAYRSVRLRMT